MSGEPKVFARAPVVSIATRTFALALLLLAGLPAAGAARSLYWAELDVDARIDAEGRLHVSERQALVFDGDWNGGERRFRVRTGQSLDLHRIVRIDPATGSEVELREGSLREVDDYRFTSRDTVRWRSRLPEDPPFSDATLVYRLDYTLSGVLEARGDAYRLDHDFAFPERYGAIESFRLDLELDPAWQAPAEFTGSVRRTNMAPGQSAIVTVDLVYVGEGRPGKVLRSISVGVRVAILLAALAAIGWFVRGLRRWEVEHGRLEPLPAVAGREWLEEHLFALRPEEAGAIWDQKIGAAEVSALLARLVAEGKLASRVREEGSWLKQRVLELELLADRESFDGPERKLIDKLFWGGRRTTDTAQVREHYRKSGFNPSATISPGLRRRLRRIPGLGRKLAGPSGWPTAALLAAALACLIVEGLTRGGQALGPLAASLIMVTVWPLPFAYGLAAVYRARSDRLRLRIFWLIVPCYLLICGVFLIILLAGRPIAFAADVRVGLAGLLGAALWCVALLRSILNMARTRDSREAVALRKKLTAAREHFRRELKRAEPALDDRWFPYLLAFGLQGEVDRWSVAHPGVASRVVPSVSSSAGASGASRPAWTGGGGAFGGAGATAAWGAAAAGLAAGVARPSSGGSGGGGGGGGGSSGGGGGGGW